MSAVSCGHGHEGQPQAGQRNHGGERQRAGLIAYDRGRITVLDRAGLEAASCECYRVVRAEFDRLLGPTAGG